MKGFSLIEIMMALALLGMLVFSISYAALNLALIVNESENTYGALQQSRMTLAQFLTQPTHESTSTTSTTSIEGIYKNSFSIEEREDEALQTTHSVTSWISLLGGSKNLELQTDILSGIDTENTCDDFVLGDWTKPVVAGSYNLSTSSGTKISALGTDPTYLVATLSSTSNATAPSINFYKTQEDSSLLSYVAGFDNASTSRVGFSSVSVAKGFVFAGNAFGSKSAQTCGDTLSCAQIHVFSLDTENSPRLLSTLPLSTSSAPWAQTITGETAGASSVIYYQGFLYVGLQKTISGYEFNIVDAHDPAHLIWISGLPIGRTVSSITVRGSKAYITTDDPAAELQIIDIVDSKHPKVISTFNAPGASGFGFGTAVQVRGSSVRLGRSYSPNGPEFELLFAKDDHTLTSIQDVDEGISKDPVSIRSFLSIDTLNFVLLTNRLEFWNTANPSLLQVDAPPYSLPTGSNAAALACKEDLLYVARNMPTGGVIDVLHGS